MTCHLLRRIVQLDRSFEIRDNPNRASDYDGYLVLHSSKSQSLSEGEVVDAVVTADDGAGIDVHQVARLRLDVVLDEVLKTCLPIAPLPDEAVRRPCR